MYIPLKPGVNLAGKKIKIDFSAFPAVSNISDENRSIVLSAGQFLITYYVNGNNAHIELTLTEDIRTLNLGTVATSNGSNWVPLDDDPEGSGEFLVPETWDEGATRAVVDYINPDSSLVQFITYEGVIQNKKVIRNAADKYATDIFNSIYPVGSIYMSMNALLPEEFPGVWEKIEGKFLLGTNMTRPNSKVTGGAETVELTLDQMPNHTHGFTYTTPVNQGRPHGNHDSDLVSGLFVDFDNVTRRSNTDVVNSHPIRSGCNAHNNMPPFITCHIWQRIA